MESPGQDGGHVPDSGSSGISGQTWTPSKTVSLGPKRQKPERAWSREHTGHSLDLLWARSRQAVWNQCSTKMAPPESSGAQPARKCVSSTGSPQHAHASANTFSGAGNVAGASKSSACGALDPNGEHGETRPPPLRVLDGEQDVIRGAGRPPRPRSAAAAPPAGAAAAGSPAAAAPPTSSCARMCRWCRPGGTVAGTRTAGSCCPPGTWEAPSRAARPAPQLSPPARGPTHQAGLRAPAPLEARAAAAGPPSRAAQATGRVATLSPVAGRPAAAAARSRSAALSAPRLVLAGTQVPGPAAPAAPGAAAAPAFPGEPSAGHAPAPWPPGAARSGL